MSPKTCTTLFISVLVITPNFSSTVEWITMCWYVHVMENYLVLKSEPLLTKNTESFKHSIIQKKPYTRVHAAWCHLHIIQKWVKSLLLLSEGLLGMPIFYFLTPWWLCKCICFVKTHWIVHLRFAWFCVCVPSFN